eukprot:m.11793 g.11793  ORF g.11793 m.11793 type:complete len:59 (-) comp6664_c0_seq1:170-346(-)
MRLKALLLPEAAAFGETSLATGWLAEDLRAVAADDDCGSMGEDGGDESTSRAADIHKV